MALSRLKRARLSGQSLVETLVSLCILGALALLAFGSLQQAQGAYSARQLESARQHMSSQLQAFDGWTGQRASQKGPFRFFLRSKRVHPTSPFFELSISCHHKGTLLMQRQQILQVPLVEVP
jgi:type II secretory pathway pseudopilin PulG